VSQQLFVIFLHFRLDESQRNNVTMCSPSGCWPRKHAAHPKAGYVKAEVVQTSSRADGLDIYNSNIERSGLFSETV